MSSPDTDTCDRCGATIVHEPFGQTPQVLQFALPSEDHDDDEVVYEEEIRLLCEACEADLLKWIDDGELDRSDCVALPRSVKSARAIRQTANTLEIVAKTLEDELETDG